MGVFNAVQSVLSIIFMIGIGYVLARRKWFDESTSGLFSKLVINISLPAMMISSIMSNFDSERLKSSGMGLFIPFISMIIVYLIAVLISAIVKIDRSKRGLFQTMFFVSNTVFIGMPVNIALFGDSSIPYVLLYYFANTTLFWTLGIRCIQKDSSNGRKEKLLTVATLKRIFSPPLLGFALAVILVLLRIQLPQFIMDSCKYVGNMTTPLSLIFIGITFNSLNIREAKPSIDMLILLAGRFVMAPLVVYGLTLIIPIPVLMAKVFIVQAAMPVIVQSAITAKAFGADYKYATVMVAVTTAVSLLSIPIYIYMMSGM